MSQILKTEKTNYDNHLTNKNNPHAVTASQIGAAPNTRTINGKSLSDDITLTQTDLGMNTWYEPFYFDIFAMDELTPSCYISFNVWFYISNNILYASVNDIELRTYNTTSSSRNFEYGRDSDDNGGYNINIPIPDGLKPYFAEGNTEYLRYSYDEPYLAAMRDGSTQFITQSDGSLFTTNIRPLLHWDNSSQLLNFRWALSNFALFAYTNSWTRFQPYTMIIPLVPNN